VTDAPDPGQGRHVPNIAELDQLAVHLSMAGDSFIARIEGVADLSTLVQEPAEDDDLDLGLEAEKAHLSREQLRKFAQVVDQIGNAIVDAVGRPEDSGHNAAATNGHAGAGSRRIFGGAARSTVAGR
jgi:hypothetical protein